MSTRFLISGMVQGVGFRWFVARHARALGLAGYARNLPDGRVEVVVSGPEEALPALERLLREGPANAQVQTLERSSEASPMARGNTFDILQRRSATVTRLATALHRTIRPIPDYPKPGIVFQDITPVLRDPALFQAVIADLSSPFADAGVTQVLGIEARGFILGGAVAIALGAGFVPARKPGKLPWARTTETYDLEYGRDALEAHRDAVSSGDRVLIVDDVLATGGTARAAGQLVTGLGAELVGWSFLLEIGSLQGRARLRGAPCHVVTTC